MHNSNITFHTERFQGHYIGWIHINGRRLQGIQATGSNKKEVKDKLMMDFIRKNRVDNPVEGEESKISE